MHTKTLIKALDVRSDRVGTPGSLIQDNRPMKSSGREPRLGINGRNVPAELGPLHPTSCKTIGLRHQVVGCRYHFIQNDQDRNSISGFAGFYSNLETSRVRLTSYLLYLLVGHITFKQSLWHTARDQDLHCYFKPNCLTCCATTPSLIKQ
jgi:hypothetical protein